MIGEGGKYKFKALYMAKRQQPSEVLLTLFDGANGKFYQEMSSAKFGRIKRIRLSVGTGFQVFARVFRRFSEKTLPLFEKRSPCPSSHFGLCFVLQLLTRAEMKCNEMMGYYFQAKTLHYSDIMYSTRSSSCVSVKPPTSPATSPCNPSLNKSFMFTYRPSCKYGAVRHTSSNVGVKKLSTFSPNK